MNIIKDIFCLSRDIIKQFIPITNKSLLVISLNENFFINTKEIEKELGPKRFYKLIDDHSKTLTEIANVYLLYYLENRNFEEPSNKEPLDIDLITSLFDKTIFLNFPQKDFPFFFHDTIHFLTEIKTKFSLSDEEMLIFYKSNLNSLMIQYANFLGKNYKPESRLTNKDLRTFDLLSLFFSLHTLQLSAAESQEVLKVHTFMHIDLFTTMTSKAETKEALIATIRLFLKTHGVFLSSEIQSYLTYLAGIQGETVFRALNQLSERFPILKGQFSDLTKSLSACSSLLKCKHLYDINFYYHNPVF